MSLSLAACDPPPPGNDTTIEDISPRGGGIKIDDIWTGSFLKFDLVTFGNLQAAAYYNSARQLVVAVRSIGSDTWAKKVLLSGASVWDSHRSVTLAFDDLGYLHVSGNMHNSPLNYFRSAIPIQDPTDLLASDFSRVTGLGGAASGAISPEQKVTYPNFMRGPAGEFIFSYRERNLGTTSGGIWVMLKYDYTTHAYTRYSPTPLFQWNGLYSVYPKFTLKKGVMHVVFLWRDVGGAEKNFNLGYIRSTDLVNWKDGFGRAVTLPITPSSLITVIDPVPVGGGLNSAVLDVSREGSAVVVYHKYEPATGYSQVYAARPSPIVLGQWMIQKLTKNQAGYRWKIAESGEVLPMPPISATIRQQTIDNGVSVIKVNFGGTENPDSGDYAIDQGLLTPLLTPFTTQYPAGRNQWLRSSSFVSCNSQPIPSSLQTLNTTYEAPPDQAKMVTRTAASRGALSELQYYLRWETLPSYNDLPRCAGAQVTPCAREITPPPAEVSLYRNNCDFSVPVTNSGGQLIAKVLKPQSATLSGGMSLTPDFRLAFGNSLSSADSSSASKATWTFDVQYAGYYALSGNAFGPSPTSDSFWIKIDDTTPFDWHFVQAGSQEWVEQPVTEGTGRAQKSFYLNPGTHTITLSAREPGAQLQYLWLYVMDSRLTHSNSAVSTSGFDGVTHPDPSAVSGSSVSSSLTNTNITAARATFSISVNVAGKYLILGRTKTQGAGHAKFVVGINGPALSLWTLPNSMNTWSWGIVPLGAGDGIVSLPAGMSTINISGSETGASIDSFYAHYLGP